MKTYNKFKDIFYLVLGALVSALSLDMFLTPNNIAAGGASGLGTILYNSIGVPVSVTVFGVNIILFAVGYKRLGKKTIIRTFAATFLMSAFIQIFSFLKPLTNDMILAAAFGGVLLGIGSGLTIASGASTGGTDFFAILLNAGFKHIPIANFILFIDLIITLLSGIVFKDYTLLLYSLFSLYICTRFVDKIIDGFRYARLVYVISNKNAEISKKVLNELDMGVTALYGKGMYSNKEQIVLMFAIRRDDFPKFRKVVEQIDKDAFIILTEANEVLGEGFNN